MSAQDAEALLADFVAIDTTSSLSNQALVERISGLVRGDGVRIEELADPSGTKKELLVTVGPDSNTGSGLVLSGHTDTVPATEPEWESDPFALTDAGDRWIARGSCDMKGFLALAVEAFCRARDRELQAPLALLLTSDEELGSLGARRFVASYEGPPLPRACVIGEPTCLRVIHRHKGHYRLRLDILGVTAHSGFPHRGDNAIERAGLAIAELTSLRRDWETDSRQDLGLEVPFLTLNLGTISGGRAVNVVPDLATIEIGVRPLPGIRSGDLGDEIEARLDKALPKDSWRLTAINDSPALLTAPDAPIHASLCRLTGQTEPDGTSFASDGGTFSELGLDCLLFGPGSIEVAHKPNEFLPKNEFDQARKILSQLIDEFCL